MIQIRRSAERGHFNHGWLDTYHTFSFAGYFDPAQMGFGPLRVINEDRVQAGQGFGTHGHRDMEIVSYVLEGALAHKDSMGSGSTLRPGDVQRMSAGTGITHSEFNASRTEPAHFLQIWLLPEREGLKPEYEEKRFDEAEKRDRLRLIASPDAADGSLAIHQDARIYAARLGAGRKLEYAPAPGRKLWLQVVEGNLEAREAEGAKGAELAAGDGAAITDAPSLALEAKAESHFLLFDLA